MSARCGYGLAAAWASRQCRDEKDGDLPTPRRDRVVCVTFWPDEASHAGGSLSAGTAVSCAIVTLRGNRTPLGDQESVSGDGKRRMVVEAAPSASLVVAESKLLLQILIITLDAPAQLGEIDQRLERRGRRQGREKVLGRLLLGRRPFDQQPFFHPWRRPPAIAMGGANAYCREPGLERAGAALPPSHGAVARPWQGHRQCLGRDRAMLGVSPHQL